MGQYACFYTNLPLAGLAALLTGCASAGLDSAQPTPQSSWAEYTAAKNTPGVATNASVPDVLNLSDALALALRGNPGLTALSHEVRAAEARMLQAGLRPNPELGLDIDEFDRDGAGFDSAESSVVIGQLFELGNKRKWRQRGAQAEGELAGWDYESKRLELVAETARRFLAVLAAQARNDLARLGVELADKTDRAVNERVKAGKEPPLQASRSQAALEMARLDAVDAEGALAVARQKLAACWGAQQPEFETVQGDLNRMLAAVPPLEALRSFLARNPDLMRWETELRLRQATLASEKAARIPDLQGSVGVVHYEEDGTDALTFGVGLPLPLFDRNQGNIAAAIHGLNRAEAERRAAAMALADELAEAHAALTVAHQRVAALRGRVLPAMEQAFQAAHAGYEQGKFGFLDVLEAQRSLFETQAALLDAQSGYHTAVIDIQRLTATNIEDLANEVKEN